MKPDAGLNLAFKANAEGKDSVLLEKGGAIRLATSPRFSLLETKPISPIVTMLQHIDIGVSEGATMYSTCEPSEMCKGMARLYKVESISYPRNGFIRTYKSSRKNPTDTGGPAYKVPANGATPDASWTKYETPKTVPDFEIPELVGYLNLKNKVNDQAGEDQVLIYLALEIVRRAFNAAGFTEGNRTGAFWGHNIGCIMVDQFGNPISWGVNTNHTEKWQHAEVNMLRSYAKLMGSDTIPDKAVIYTSLEPCEMCSGLIHRMAGSSKVRVVCAMKDDTLDQTALRNLSSSSALKCEFSSAKLTATAADTGVVSSASPALSADLLSKYTTWQRANDLPMTQFFANKTFFDTAEVARAHWFLALWAQAETKFAKAYPDFALANAGRAEQKGIWGKPGVPAVPAEKLGTLLKNPMYERALEELQFTNTMLWNVYTEMNNFLSAIPNQLGVRK